MGTVASSGVGGYGVNEVDAFSGKVHVSVAHSLPLVRGLKFTKFFERPLQNLHAHSEEVLHIHLYRDT